MTTDEYRPDDGHDGDMGLPPGWTLLGYGRCSSCQADVLWCRYDVTKRRAPFNPDGVSHFATCPQAAQHRRSRP
jgi:hypothetical protein